MATKQVSFGPGLFSFLADLRANNNRDWFAANRHSYEEELLDPALAFINAFAPRLERISPHFRADARPSGGSLFRIYRDTRFSRDKSPYKTNLGIHFRHELAKEVSSPGYYLHVGPAEVFAGGGIWHPDTRAATSIREAIVAQPGRWRRATRAGTFAKRLELGGDSLKRVPSWADPQHPLADDLKLKDFFGSARLSESDVVARGFIDEYARICRAAGPLMHFFCDALGVPYQAMDTPVAEIQYTGELQVRPYRRGTYVGEEHLEQVIERALGPRYSFGAGWRGHAVVTIRLFDAQKDEGAA